MTGPFCAHFTVGGSGWHERVPSMAAARVQLWAVHNEFGFATVISPDGQVVQQDTVWLAPQCEDCTDRENHHDYPSVILVIGRRGGVRREVC